MTRLRTTQLALGIVLVAALQGCGSDESPPPKAVCGLKGELVAAVLGSNDISEGRETNGDLTTLGDAGSLYSCAMKTGSDDTAQVTAAIDPDNVTASITDKMQKMPVHFTFQHGEAALKITPHGSGDGATTGLDAYWVCGRISVRITASTGETIRETDARDLVQEAADQVGCPSA